MIVKRSSYRQHRHREMLAHLVGEDFLPGTSKADEKDLGSRKLDSLRGLGLLLRRKMPELRRMRTRNLQARTELRETRAELVKHTLAAAVEIDGHPLQRRVFAHLRVMVGP
jgi:hypothetical protein